MRTNRGIQGGVGTKTCVDSKGGRSGRRGSAGSEIPLNLGKHLCTHGYVGLDLGAEGRLRGRDMAVCHRRGRSQLDYRKHRQRDLRSSLLQDRK